MVFIKQQQQASHTRKEVAKLKIMAKGEAFRTTTLCVDSYENTVLKGRFYNPHVPEGKAVCSISQFLLEMEQTLDILDFPKSFTETRVFAPPSEYKTGPPGSEFRQGDAATFVIKILFRQNTSWQGSVTWLEGKQEQSFRSVLELLFLMDTALNLSLAS